MQASETRAGCGCRIRHLPGRRAKLLRSTSPMCAKSGAGRAVTPLPHAPKEVLGVMNLRGSVIPIYDLSLRFGLGPTPESPRNVIVVAMIDNQTVGLLVEAVSEILSVGRDRIQDTPDIRSETTKQSITGVITIEDGMTRVIDLAAVIQSRARQAA